MLCGHVDLLGQALKVKKTAKTGRKAIFKKAETCAPPRAMPCGRCLHRRVVVIGYVPSRALPSATARPTGPPVNVQRCTLQRPTDPPCAATQRGERNDGNTILSAALDCPVSGRGGLADALVCGR